VSVQSSHTEVRDMQAAVVHVQALSPLHAGTGQTVDVIDLPIARERATQLPLVPGSTVKGVLRDEARRRGRPTRSARCSAPSPPPIPRSTRARSP
jgi:CRISPR/Cas system CSM-associated protein Csm3 (group 7 of RAMP superfamily)